MKRLPLTRLREEVGSVDVFVCCCSFEERSMSIALAIDAATVGSAVIVANRSLGARAAAHLARVESAFEGRSVVARLSADDPLITADELARALGVADGQAPCRYLIDVSTFTHEALLILLRLMLLHRRSSDEVLLAYSGASEYAPGLPNEGKWLSQGVATVRSVLGYSGTILPARETHLVILVGYEHERATQLIQAVQPDRLSLGHGTAGSATSEKHQAAMAYYARLVSDATATMGNVSEFGFSCSDPLDARDHILREVSDSASSNHIVAPMNTKLSTIGSALAALRDDSIQLCYAPARLYNADDYSSPGDHCYLTSLDELLSR